MWNSVAKQKWFFIPQYVRLIPIYHASIQRRFLGVEVICNMLTCFLSESTQMLYGKFDIKLPCCIYGDTCENMRKEDKPGSQVRISYGKSFAAALQRIVI